MASKSGPFRASKTTSFKLPATELWPAPHAHRSLIPGFASTGESACVQDLVYGKRQRALRSLVCNAMQRRLQGMARYEITRSGDPR